MKIRVIQDRDIPAIRDIYAYYVINTAITFEYEVPSELDFQSRLEAILPRFPWLICEIEGKVVGYAYATLFRYREAYDWTVESSIYLQNDLRGQGIGKKLYQVLFEILKLQGFVNVIGGITLPNPASESLHLNLGFRDVGIVTKVGYKFDQWHSIKFYELAIGEYNLKTSKPLPFPEISQTQAFQDILLKY